MFEYGDGLLQYDTPTLQLYNPSTCACVLLIRSKSTYSVPHRANTKYLRWSWVVSSRSHDACALTVQRYHRADCGRPGGTWAQDW